MKDFTTKDLAVVLNVPPPVAYNFVQFLEAAKLVAPAPSRPRHGRKGRGEKVFTLCPEATERLVELLMKIATAPDVTVVAPEVPANQDTTAEEVSETPETVSA